MTPNEERIQKQFESEDRLQPGDEGWWRVWGATVEHVRTGDIICTLDVRDKELHYDEVDRIEARIPRLVVVKPDGETFNIGCLAPFLVYRKGTHNTLA